MARSVRTRITNTAKLTGATLRLIFAALVAIPVCSSVVAQDVVNVPMADPHIGAHNDVRIGVLGLFRPRQLMVSAASGSALVLRAGDERITLEKSSGLNSANIHVDGSVVETSIGQRVLRVSKITVSNRTGEPIDFILAVPGKITRHYHGTLEIRPSSGILVAVVTMDVETAVASIVAAESAPETPPEALKAQAVSTRSYLIASRGRHHEFDFCDTTHCQFLREPPAAESAVATAVGATRGLVLAYDSHPVAAMYTRSCSGRTRTPVELGLSPAAYPYFPVECPHCRAHPVRWSSHISSRDAASLRPSDESARLNIDRRLGWSTVQSNDFVVKTTADQPEQAIVEGTGQGHGIGLCQAGAKSMAEDGADFHEILNHYYPNTDVVTLPAIVSLGAARPFDRTQ